MYRSLKDYLCRLDSEHQSKIRGPVRTVDPSRDRQPFTGAEKHAAPNQVQ